MRTVIAPLDREVQAQIDTLDDRLAAIAQAYIRRLSLEPYLGHALVRGLLAEYDGRAVDFDSDSTPQQLFSKHRGRLRRGDEDASAGPLYRVVYRVSEARQTQVRLVVVLAVGQAHTKPGQEDAYDTAGRLLRRQIGESERRWQ